MVEALCGVIHDDYGVLHHGVGEAIDLASAGGNFPFAFRWVCCRVGGFDCIAVHGGYVRASEVPADTNDAALEPVCCVNSTAPRANHISSHGLPAFPLVFVRIIPPFGSCCLLSFGYGCWRKVGRNGGRSLWTLREAGTKEGRWNNQRPFDLRARKDDWDFLEARFAQVAMSCYEKQESSEGFPVLRDTFW